jgi:hypothetical protein
LLGEFSGCPKRAVHLVCRDLNEALDAMAPRAIQEHARADYVCMNKVERIVDTAIHMRFCREIDHRVKPVLGHQSVHLVGVRDIGFEKFVAFAMFFDHPIKIGEIARVSEHIHVGHVRRLVMLQNIPNKVAPDESAATGYKDAHGSAY